MPLFRVINTIQGADLGEWIADDVQSALDAMAREAGYTDHAAACEAVPVEEGELVVEEVEDVRGLIAQYLADHGDRAHDEATRFFNAPAELDADGNVWIERSGRGHWARDYALERLAEHLATVKW